MSTFAVLPGDCLEVLKDLPDNSVDSLVTDPPAGISFMGKSWDSDKGGRDQWIAWLASVMAECMRVMKPGAHGLVWAIPRTSHWTATALEDAGFEIRDVVTHHFGSGFPKSLNVLKSIESSYECRFTSPAIDVELPLKHSLVELREETTDFVLGHVVIPHEGVPEKLTVTGEAVNSSGQTVTLLLESTASTTWNIDGLWNNTSVDNSPQKTRYITLTKLKTITDSKILSLLPKLNMLANICGAGTALKPASEHWILIRKPLSERNVAANVLKWGTGAINIDASRVETDEFKEKTHVRNAHSGIFKEKGGGTRSSGSGANHASGRFPANLVLSCADTCTEDAHDTVSCPIALMDEQSGMLKSGGYPPEGGQRTQKETYGRPNERGPAVFGKSQGGASRFFYCSKASKADKGKDNTHPTVKSSKLMSYLIRMITPPQGIVLDPFTGSGSTGVSALKEGFTFIGIEREAEYLAIAEARLNNATGPMLELDEAEEELDATGTEG